MLMVSEARTLVAPVYKNGQMHGYGKNFYCPSIGSELVGPV